MHLFSESIVRSSEENSKERTICFNFPKIPVKIMCKLSTSGKWNGAEINQNPRKNISIESVLKKIIMWFFGGKFEINRNFFEFSSLEREVQSSFMSYKHFSSSDFRAPFTIIIIHIRWLAHFFLYRLYKTEQRGAKILLKAEISLLFDRYIPRCSNNREKSETFFWYRVNQIFCSICIFSN